MDKVAKKIFDQSIDEEQKFISNDKMSSLTVPIGLYLDKEAVGLTDDEIGVVMADGFDSFNKNTRI